MDMTSMDNPVETCEVCGGQVDPAEAHRAEVSAGEMCPTPMTFHRACYDKAAIMWQPDPDSACVADPDFPETARWTPRAGS